MTTPSPSSPTVAWTYRARLDALRATKLKHTQEKQEIVGSMNHDDWALTGR